MRAWASRCWWSWRRWGWPSCSCRSPGCSSGRLGIGSPELLSRESSRSALRLSLMTAPLATRGLAGARGAARVGAGPGHVSRAQRLRALRHACRWCCRRWSAASRCSSRSAAAAWSGPYLDATGSASRCRSPPPAVVVAETFVAMPFLVITVEGALRAADTRLRGGGRHPGRRPARPSSAGSPCRWSRRRSPPAPCCAGRGRSASSAPRSPSPATCPGVTQTHAARRLPRARAATRTAAFALSPGAARGRRSSCSCPARRKWLPGAATPMTGGARRLDVQVAPRGVFDARRGAWRCRRARSLGVLGPNGAGKSTLLRVVWPGWSGSAPGTSGSATAPSTTRPSGVFVPAEQRPIGVVFQDYLLFPHLTVLDNVAFGARGAGTAPRGVPAHGRPLARAARARAVRAGRSRTAALRRSGATGRPRPGARVRPGAAAPRRAALGAGRRHPRRDPERPAQAPVARSQGRCSS